MRGGQNEVKKQFKKKCPTIVPIIDDLENFRKYCLILKTVFDFPPFCAYDFILLNPRFWLHVYNTYLESHS